MPGGIALGVSGYALSRYSAIAYESVIGVFFELSIIEGLV